jgi:hypothetical protein
MGVFWCRHDRLVAALGVAGLIVTRTAEDAGRIPYLGPAGQTLFARSAGLAILGLATAEQDGTVHASRAAVFIGSASSAICLIHAPLVITAGLVLHVTRQRPVRAHVAATPPAWPKRHPSIQNKPG